VRARTNSAPARASHLDAFGRDQTPVWLPLQVLCSDVNLSERSGLASCKASVSNCNNSCSETNRCERVGNALAVRSFSGTSRLFPGEAMLAARKTTTRTPAARSTSGAPTTRSAATRRELERRVARVEKLLEDAGEALQLLGKDLGRGAGDAYTELTRTARALRRDAERTNRQMLKDLDKLRAAVTPSGTTRRQATRRASRSSGTRTATGSSRSTRATRSRSTATRTTG
jgi:hypothetical protein